VVRTPRPAPATFGGLAEGQGVLFQCKACSRAHAVERAEALLRWGIEGRTADVCRRFACTHCRGRGARAELIPAKVQIGPRWQDRLRPPETEIDKLVARVEALKPPRKVT
jgi:hypothetical protein